MGLNIDDTIFEGMITDVVTYRKSSPTILAIEGLRYDGTEATHFIEDKPIEMLRVYNTDIFKQLRELIEKYASAVEASGKYKKQYRRILI